MNKEALQRIVLYFGKSNQYKKAIEELGELIAALARWMLDQNEEKDVIEEAADVIVVLSQLTELDYDHLYETAFVDLDTIYKYLTMTVRYIIESHVDFEDVAATLITMLRRFLDQIKATEELNKMVDYKIDRTIEYIDSGKYKN